jgi:hypothetical protein
MILKTTIFIFIILFGCTQPTHNTTEIFIVPADTMPSYKTNTHDVLPPPPSSNRAYYFPSNFIIDTGEQIFYYQQKQTLNDDIRVAWTTPPLFINLQPKDIIQIPVKSIAEFITLNILNKDSLIRYVAVASIKDTTQSVGLSKIVTLLNDSANHIRWKFRKVTQEEAIVLDYKKRQANYYPDEIKWDTTKIRFK